MMNRRDVLFWIGTGNYNVGLFTMDRYGISDKQVGGKWGEDIPLAVLETMEKDGLLSSSPNGGMKNFHVTWKGQQEAAKVYYGI